MPRGGKRPGAGRKKQTTREAAPGIRDRIKELRRVPAAELLDNEKNWSIHTQEQREGLGGVLQEIGYADALIAYELPDKSLKLIDGHLRKEITPDATVPVLVLDVNEAEANTILATLDPLAAMKQADAKRMDALMRDIQTGNEAVGKMLTDIAQKHQVIPDLSPQHVAAPDEDGALEEDAEEDSLDLLFKSPYPWFGGKSRVASKVWKRFGDVKGYIEPFFGSGAVFLNRPQPFDGVETINDFDALVCNFWRAVQAAPDGVAKWCDWPVNENDLTARHAWLVARKDALTAKLEGAPDYFDVQIAGWWCWGMSLWIGGGFCEGKGPWQIVEAEDGSRQLVHLGDEGRGINRKLVHLGDEGQGINRKRVHLGGHGGQGVNAPTVHDAEGERAGLGERGLKAWMQALSERLHRVRVCCGDWKRVCGGNSGDALCHFFAGGEPCGIFLDPPYAAEADRDESIYRCDDLQVAHAVREWAIAHGDDPRLRIALCGYDGEHQMPASWECVKWKAHGGMAGLGNGDDTRGKQNKFRERLWFSPHCLR